MFHGKHIPRRSKKIRQEERKCWKAIDAVLLKAVHHELVILSQRTSLMRSYKVTSSANIPSMGTKGENFI